jgi:uncharacterized membrane protein YkoI
VKKIQTIITTTFVGAAFAFGSLVVQANEDLLVNKASINIEEAMAIAVKAVPGKVISAGFDKENMQLLWEVEVLTADQKVMELEIDANDGKVLKQQQDMD